VSAVSQRSTMGVASLDAAAKFHTTAEQLSILAVAQLAVYAAMQIPVGVLLDRFGARILLAFGALSMAAGQFTVAYASNLSLAVIGRMLVGFGDAFTFISLIRLINGWYSGRRASQLQQWLGNAGQAGQIVSAVPFAYLLHTTGWITSFSMWATIAAIFAVASWFLVRDEPTPGIKRGFSFSNSGKLLRESVKLSSTRMAFWVHFTTQSSTTVIVLLWGVPFLEQAEGLPKATVSAILSSFVLIGFVVGLCYGQLCAHRPQWRRNTLLVSTSLTLASWALLISWPGPAPLPLIVVWLVFTSMTAPASMVAFDYTRQYVPKHELGTANGFVNIGGFVASFTMMFIIGLVLDVRFALFGKAAGETLYSINGFRTAFITVILIVGFGLSQYLRNEKITRNQTISE